MSNKIDKRKLEDYFNLSKEIAEFESRLYGSAKELEKNEFKISELVKRQNLIRFDENQNDLFREQLESVLRLLAEHFENFGFDNNLYFDLVYNLMVLDYDKFISLDKEQVDIASMLKKIGIDDHIKEKTKALLTHTCGGGCG